ncbi:MAG: methyltransferase domain-containing protein [Gammaproteobacteria bacterium]|nr:methyltransferase domain-containing protein [Gammaproteobacteria bacterium]
MIEIEKLPVEVSDLYASYDEALAAVRGEISLGFCHHCTFVFNQAYETEKIQFKPGYEASLAHTRTFRQYIDDLSQRLIANFELRNKSVLDIGCGDGYLLKELCRRGANRGVGIDPTIKQEKTEQVGNGSVQFISKYFSAKYQSFVKDFICSISVFETMPDPRQFLTDLRKMIGSNQQTGVYFEVPNASYMFERQATWSIYYEQFGHYTAQSLASLFRLCDFEVLDCGTCYEDGQYVFVEARPGASEANGQQVNGSDRHDLPSPLKDFARVHKMNVSAWKVQLQQMHSDGDRIMAWGSGGKGSSFLNLLDTRDLIPYVVDINPERQGKHIAGSAQEIVPPEYCATFKPDVIVITNPIYEREIKKQVYELGVKCRFVSI